MISFNYETDLELDNEILFSEWISKIIVSENKTEGEINYIFCDDEYLHKINLEYLQHDDLTDVISFDYSVGNELHGDIFISIERVKENAADYAVTFNEELKRVMAHGVLHYAGYKDKTEKDAAIMRTKENEKIALFDN
jgi:probable rRNA maturation factor